MKDAHGYHKITHVRFLCSEKGKLMMNKDFTRHIAYEALVILGVLALLLFVCRLWPILLLVILGISISAIRLLFLTQTRVESVELPDKPQPAPKDPTEEDIQDLAYSLVQKKITHLVTEAYPEARWVWKTPRAKEKIFIGGEVRILLNRAGGYREAAIQIQNLRISSLEFCNAPEKQTEDLSGETHTEQEKPVQTNVNFEYLAFEWVDAHAMALNMRCNEHIAQGHTSFLLQENELPDREAWPDICRELARNGIEDCQCMDQGIQISLAQEACRKG